MNKLWKLAPWIAIDDAARRMAKALDDDVSPTQLLSLAVDGQLMLSAKIPVDVVGRWGDRAPVPKKHKGEDRSRWVAGVPVPGGYQEPWVAPDAVHLEVGFQLNLEGRISFVERGIYDLPMIGAGRKLVEHAIAGPTGSQAWRDATHHAFLGKGDRLCFLLEHIGDVDHPAGRQRTQDEWNALNERIGDDWADFKNYRAALLPSGTELGVRGAELALLVDDGGKKARGSTAGWDDSKWAEIDKRREDGDTEQKIAEDEGVSRTALSNWMKKWKEQKPEKVLNALPRPGK